MALDQSALLEVLDALKAAGVDDRIRQAAETIYQALIEAELASVIGALPHERPGSRTGHRNGYRARVLASTAGDLELRIPKLRAGSFSPSLLERRRRVDQSLFAVIMEAYLHGTSTRKVDDLVKALGADSGISKSEVSRICADLDTEVAAFRDRSLAGQAFGMCSWMRPTARPASITGWCPRRSWWPPGWPPTGIVKCSGSRSVTARTGRSGPRSCGR
jgi:putative transposase